MSVAVFYGIFDDILQYLFEPVRISAEQTVAVIARTESSPRDGELIAVVFFDIAYDIGEIEFSPSLQNP